MFFLFIHSFERKLVSHMSKGFDPFKPLSINTSALESSASTSSTSATTTVKKQSVLYESLQQHPLAKYHQTQQQTTTTTTVDGQTSSRMELHKATLANATIDPVPVGSSSESSLPSTPHALLATKILNLFFIFGTEFVTLPDKPDKGSSVATLADIAESSGRFLVCLSRLLIVPLLYVMPM